MQNCYNTGERIPREKQFEQDERLTNKHIQTLQFVQEVVRENKELKKQVEEYELNQLKCKELHALAEESKDRIKTIQEQYLKRADEINAMMAEKHRGELIKVVNEKLEQEQKYSEEIVKMKQEVTQLETTISELMAKIADLSGAQEKMEMMAAEAEDFKRVISDLTMEVDALRDENRKITGEKHSQFSQIQSLQSLKESNESLANELKAMTQKNFELSHKCSRLESDLQEASTAKDQADLIDQLKNKLAKLHKERSIVNEKEEFYQKQIGDLKYEVQRLLEKVQNAEVTKDRVLEEYHKVNAELQHLKRTYSNNSQHKNFKEFVKLKREVAYLKEENQDLRHNSKFHMSSNESTASLPMLRYEPTQEMLIKAAAERKSKPRKTQSLTSK